MRYLFFLAFISIISLNGNSQIYYSLGLKAQRIKFESIYETDEEYVYNNTTGNYELSNGIDTSSRKFFSFGPTLCYGFNYDISDQVAVAGELEGHLGILTIKSDGFYFDFNLGARCSYTINPATYSNVFLRLGVGYGMNRGYDDNDVIGLNWRLGYEHDFDNFLLGMALDGNVFLEDLSYYGSIDQERLLSRKLNSIGLAVYCSIGKN